MSTKNLGIENTRALRALAGGGLSVDPEGRKMVLRRTGLPALFLPALVLPETIFACSKLDRSFPAAFKFNVI